MFICQGCGHVSAQTFTRAGNAQAWAIGKVNTNKQFTVRKVVWGLTLAQCEKRIDEEIRGCLLMIEKLEKKRGWVIPKEMRHAD